MRFHLIPREVTSRSATIGVAGLGIEGADPRAVVRVRGVAHPIAGWKKKRGVHHQQTLVEGLSAGTRYAVDLLVDGAVVATSSLTTLPAALPRPGDDPFTIFLGSCFCGRQDKTGDVERAYATLPPGASPAVHVWCGDQVYLDSPWHRFARPHSTSELEALFLDNYDVTWGDGRGSGALGGILSKAANYFTSDDHEFWNNAPNRGAYVTNSWTEAGRKTWMSIASDLYRAFQTESTVSELRVGNVSLLVADVRIDRDAEEERFMRDADLRRVCDWLRSLQGPGFLALGQPVFTEEHGFLGHFLDWGLADYEQYDVLARALSAVEHSVVVLTGDVHYGRVAHCALRTGGEVVEIISSPLALVDPSVRGTWKPAPDKFPSKPVAGVVQSDVVTETFQTNETHFLTLELTAIGQAVQLIVKYWPIGRSTEPRGREVFRRRLR